MGVCVRSGVGVLLQARPPIRTSVPGLSATKPLRSFAADEASRLILYNGIRRLFPRGRASATPLRKFSLLRSGGHDVLEQMHVQRQFEHAREGRLSLRAEVSCRLRCGNRRGRNNWVIVHMGRRYGTHVRPVSALMFSLLPIKIGRRIYSN